MLVLEAWQGRSCTFQPGLSASGVCKKKMDLWSGIGGNDLFYAFCHFSAGARPSLELIKILLQNTLHIPLPFRQLGNRDRPHPCLFIGVFGATSFCDPRFAKLNPRGWSKATTGSSEGRISAPFLQTGLFSTKAVE